MAGIGSSPSRQPRGLALPDLLLRRMIALHDDAQRLERLHSFGLSEYQARAYLALLRIGVTDARSVARAARVPIAKIYGTLEQLAGKGLAILEPTLPRRYAAVPFQSFLAKRQEALLQQAREIAALEGDLVPLFQLDAELPTTDRGSIHVTRGRSEAQQAFRGLVQAARRDLLLVPSRGWARRARHDLDVLREAHARGVQLRVLLGADPGLLAGLLEIAEVRERPPRADGADVVTLAVADAEETLMVHHVPDDAGTLRGNDVALLVREEGFVRVLRDLAEADWLRTAPAPRA